MKNLNEFEIETLNTTVGTYRLIFVSKGDHDEHQITKNRIVLRRFWGCEEGLQKAQQWLNNMQRTDVLEDENADLNDEINKCEFTAKRFVEIQKIKDKNFIELAELRQKLFPINY